jgi:hypothetical protein
MPSERSMFCANIDIVKLLGKRNITESSDTLTSDTTYLDHQSTCVSLHIEEGPFSISYYLLCIFLTSAEAIKPLLHLRNTPCPALRVCVIYGGYVYFLFMALEPYWA